MRRAARKDDNHSEIEAAFKGLGWSVKDVSQLKNFVDIVASNGKRTILVEVKDGSKIPSKRKLTDGERAFKESWKGEWFLVESVDDVIKINSTGQAA